jgi:hypothetical protein
MRLAIIGAGNVGGTLGTAFGNLAEAVRTSRSNRRTGPSLFVLSFFDAFSASSRRQDTPTAAGPHLYFRSMAECVLAKSLPSPIRLKWERAPDAELPRRNNRSL